ncbi:MAG: DNA/RNA non-specific endonuclease, partial [Crocinitomicaceae bacterium]
MLFLAFKNVSVSDRHCLACPSLHPGEIILSHTAYSFSYNEEHEQANWVAYLLTKTHLGSGVERSDRFMEDPIVSTGTATNADYAKSGYDRGHLAPAADMSWSETVMQESFYYSNMSPQLPGFNRGIWKRLEEQVRTWAEFYDSIYVVTGPVLSPELPKIGPNQVSVPKYY